MKFKLQHSSDGIPSQYGNIDEAALEDMVEELIYFDDIRVAYNTESLRDTLTKIKVGDYIHLGDRWTTKTIRRLS